MYRLFRDDPRDRIYPPTAKNSKQVAYVFQCFTFYSPSGIAYTHTRVWRGACNLSVTPQRSRVRLRLCSGTRSRACTGRRRHLPALTSPAITFAVAEPPPVPSGTQLLTLNRFNASL
jgi:hypothetical protein